MNDNGNIRLLTPENDMTATSRHWTGNAITTTRSWR